MPKFFLTVQKKSKYNYTRIIIVTQNYNYKQNCCQVL